MKVLLGFALGVVLAALATIMVVAWIRGGPQPTRWIEIPVKAPAGTA